MTKTQTKSLEVPKSSVTWNKMSWNSLKRKKLKDLIKTHSEFIAFPIELLVEKTKEEEVSDDDSDEEEGEKKEGEEGEKKEGEEGDDNIE